MPARPRKIRKGAIRTTPCLDGGGSHAWDYTGLDVLSVAPDKVGTPGNLIRTRRCVWCTRSEYAVQDGNPPRWKEDRRGKSE